jgi:hypothetical protein
MVNFSTREVDYDGRSSPGVEVGAGSGITFLGRERCECSAGQLLVFLMVAREVVFPAIFQVEKGWIQ